MNFRNIFRKKFVLIAAFCIPLSLVSLVFAETTTPLMIEIDEDIMVDTVFSRGTTYIIKCENFCTLADDFEITVQNGATLTIEPGAKIILESNLGFEYGSRMQLGSLTGGQPVVTLESELKTITFYSGSSGYLHNCTYSGGGKVVDGAVPALTIAASNVEIDRCVFSGHNGDNLFVTGDGLAPKFNNLTLIGNGELTSVLPIVQDADSFPVYRNVEMSGFDSIGVHIAYEHAPCDLNPMNEFNVSGVLDGSGLNGAPFIFSWGGVKVPTGVSVTLAAGTKVLVGNCQSGGSFQVDGHLEIDGTANQPIVFDAWGDGWRGLTINAEGSADIEHCELYKDNLAILSSDVAVANCTFDVSGPSSNRPAVYIGDGNIRPMLSHITATGSSAYGIELHPNSSPIFHDVQIVGNEHSQLKIQTNDDSLFSDFSVVELSDVVWDGSGLNGAGIYAPGLVIEEQADLTIKPGSRLELWSGQSIDIYGTLAVSGSTDSLVTITSWDEDFVNPSNPMYWGYISVRDGGSADFKHCDIKFGAEMVNINQGGTATFSNCQIHESRGSGIVISGDADIATSAIYDNARYGIHVRNNATPSIRLSSFANNGLYAVYNETSNRSLEATVDARNNWWGVASGPTLDTNGLGERVSGGVLYSPWLTMPSNETPAVPTRNSSSIYLPLIVR